MSVRYVSFSFTVQRFPVVGPPTDSNQVIEDSMRDTDKVLAKFFDFCQAAGTRCALYRPGDSASNIRARFEGVMASLRAEPLIIVPKHSGVPFTLTHSDVRGALFQSLYFPVRGFPVLASFIDALYRGSDLEPYLVKPDLTPLCAPLKSRVYPDDSGFSISCADRQYEVNETIAGLQASFDRLGRVTSFADIVSALPPRLL